VNQPGASVTAVNPGLRRACAVLTAVGCVLLIAAVTLGVTSAALRGGRARADGVEAACVLLAAGLGCGGATLAVAGLSPGRKAGPAASAQDGVGLFE